MIDFTFEEMSTTGAEELINEAETYICQTQTMNGFVNLAVTMGYSAAADGWEDVVVPEFKVLVKTDEDEVAVDVFDGEGLADAVICYNDHARKLWAK